MLRFAESCDQATSANDVKARGWSGSPSGGVVFGTTAGKTGGGALSVVGSEQDAFWYRTISLGTGLVRCAAWFKSAAVPTSADRWLIRFSNTAANQHGGIKTTITTGVIKAYPWSSGSPAAIGAGATNVGDGNWHYIEVECYFANSGGSFKVWVDGTLEIHVSGDTFDAGTVALDRLYIGVYSGTSFADDILLWDDTGGGLTGDLGGKAYLMKTLRPTSDASVQFTRSTGANNYGCVDEQGLATSDYVEDGTSGHLDRYGFADTGLTSEPVKAVIVEIAAANPGAGTINANLLAEQGGTTVESAVVAVPASTAILQAEFLTNPAGGAWTMADADAATFGVKVA